MKKILIILIIFYPIHSYTQGWSFEYSLGYGAYQLDNIKAIQNGILESNKYNLKEFDHFPNGITHTFALGYMIGNSHLGSNFTYLTTGGRLHRADYSGSYTVDMIINGYRLGAFFREYVNIRNSPFKIYLQISSGVLFSNLKMKEEIYIYSESAKESNTLKGVGMYVEPTIGVTYRLTDWLRFSLSGGYEYDLLGTLKINGEKTQTKANWSGLRLYGGFAFFLPNRK